jgi:hypothetical protein
VKKKIPALRPHHRLKWLINRHWALTLVVMCCSVFVFSLMSFNLFHMWQENVRVISESGSTVLFDGALQQLFELTVSSFIAAVCYVIFKACEKVLVEKILK